MVKSMSEFDDGRLYERQLIVDYLKLFRDQECGVYCEDKCYCFGKSAAGRFIKIIEKEYWRITK